MFKIQHISFGISAGKFGFLKAKNDSGNKVINVGHSLKKNQKMKEKLTAIGIGCSLCSTCTK